MNTQSKSDELKESNKASPEYIGKLANSIFKRMSSYTRQINAVNLNVRLLSFNAQIEAARAGAMGRSFSVVATEMGNLSTKTAAIADALTDEVNQEIGELKNISKLLSTQVRGIRLSDLALTNIELIDRNLYERTCDVRWWATDDSVVRALANPTPEQIESTCQRLSVILKAYTVYYDIVLCCLEGRIIANGKPGLYRSQGKSAQTCKWFTEAMDTHSGDEYGFQSVHRSPFVNNEHVLCYSCTVRENGEARGRVIGVLGVLFNWESLAQTIMQNTPLDEEEKKRSRVFIADDEGTILADSEGSLLGKFDDMDSLKKTFSENKSFTLRSIHGDQELMACAKSPGYETYKTGWSSFISQRLAVEKI